MIEMVEFDDDTKDEDDIGNDTEDTKSMQCIHHHSHHHNLLSLFLFVFIFSSISIIYTDHHHHHRPLLLLRGGEIRKSSKIITKNTFSMKKRGLLFRQKILNHIQFRFGFILCCSTFIMFSMKICGQMSRQQSEASSLSFRKIDGHTPD